MKKENTKKLAGPQVEWGKEERPMLRGVWLLLLRNQPNQIKS